MYTMQPVDNDCCIKSFDFQISEYFTLFLNTLLKITYYSSGTPNDLLLYLLLQYFLPSYSIPFLLLSMLPTLRFFICVLRKKFFEKLMLSWQSVILSKIKLYRSE